MGKSKHGRAWIARVAARLSGDRAEREAGGGHCDAGTHAVWESRVTAATLAPWTALYTDTSTTPGRGYVVADPSTPAAVWIANTHGLGVIDTAACGANCTPDWVSSEAGGPLAAATTASGDWVYMAGTGPSPAFWEVQVIGCPVTCPDAAGFADPYYAQIAPTAVALAAGTDGSFYVATRGNGVAVGTTP